ncbi:MAG: CinA family protein [Alphaproteobacteria bacterium]|nr:CinA family protein [Alphaproteobacteria bacterium]
MFSAEILKLAQTILAKARNKGLKIVTAESCTGGLVAGALTEIAGSSDVFERGFITYSNEAKRDLLGVPQTTLDQFGAVSEPTARAMAEGALKHAPADLSVAVTGVAGPGGGSPEKPVGLVHFAAARRGHATLSVEHRFGDTGRQHIRTKSIEAALTLLQRLLA